jgi:cytochrome P450
VAQAWAEPDLRWRAHGLPDGPRLGGRLRSGDLFRQNALEYLQDNARRFGDLVRFRALGREVLQFNHPELISEMLVRDAGHHHRNLVMQRSKAVLGEGLLTSEEPLHMRQRRLAQPAFHRARIQGYAQTIVEVTARLTSAWTPGDRDVHADMLLLALRIVGRTLFSMEFDEDLAAIARAVDAFQYFLPLAFVPFPELMQRLPLPVMRRIRQGREDMDRLIYRAIAERRADPGDRGDLLSMLLSSVDTEEDTGAEARMSDTQVRDECVTVLLAGHETTANALSFILWQVALHPALQDELAAEVSAVLDGRPPTADDYPRLQRTEQVVAEGLRLYPPVWVTSRAAAEDYAYRGTVIHKGAFLLAPQIVTHLDPRFWDEPLRFNPDRFTREAKANRPRLAYFPFGAGSRQCIGEGLAWMEGVLCLAIMVQGWRFSVAADADPELKLSPNVTLRPKGPVRLRLERR